MSRKAKYRILIVEPSNLVSAGLREVLNSNDSFEVAGTLADLSHAGEKITLLDPDALMINPTVTGFSRKTSVRGLVSKLEDTALIAIMHDIVPDEILKQFDGHITLYEEAPQILKKIKSAVDDRRESDTPAQGNELSEREKEILISVARGATNKEIASEHNISVHTVISHRKNISRKTGIKSVSGLTIYAMLNGLIDITDID